MSTKKSQSVRKEARKHASLVSAGVLAAAMSPTVVYAAGEAKLDTIHVSDTKAIRSGYQSATTTVGKRNMEVQELPQSITIINQQLMRDQATTDLKEALKNAGVTFQAGEGGQTEVPIIRGMHAGGDVYDDGMRGAGSQFNSDTFNTDSVEILKGSAAVLFGRGAAGGIINQVSKSPFIGHLAEVDVSLGNRDFKRATADINHAFNDDIAVRLNVMGEKRESFRKPVETDKWGIAPSVAFGLSGNTQFELGYKHEKADQFPDFGVPYRSTGSGTATAAKDLIKQNFGYNTDFEDIRNDSVTAKFKHAFNDHLSISNTLRYGKTDYDLLVYAPRWQRGGEAQIGRALNGMKATQYQADLWSNQTDVNAKFDTGVLKHDLLATVELTREKRTNYQSRYSFFNADGSPATSNPYDTNTHYGAPKENLYFTRDVTESGVLTTRTVGVGISDIVDITPKLKAIAGVRFDHIDTRNNPSGGGEKRQRTDDLFNYNAGVVYEPALGHNIYATYGTSSAPVAYRVTGQAVSLDNTQVDLVNEPERTKTFEIGSKNTFLNGDLTVNSALFHTKKTQQYYRDAGFIDSVTMYGLDLEMAGRITDRWNMIGGIVWANGKMKSDPNHPGVGQLNGHMPEAAAKLSANLWTNYHFTDAFHAGIGARYVGDRYTQSRSGINQKLPSYVVADAMVGYETPRYRAQLNVNNVFDKKHFASGHRQQAIPGEARSIIATFGYKF